MNGDRPGPDKDMKYYVVWTAGSCNDGDHDYGWEEFDTLDLAQNKLDDLLKQGRYNGTASLIAGTTIRTANWG